jgi:hypothetical protein
VFITDVRHPHNAYRFSRKDWVLQEQAGDYN